MPSSRPYHRPTGILRYGLVALTLIFACPLADAADPQSFVGTWSTTYGRMVLAEKDGGLSGTYGRNGIAGIEKEGKFAFAYYEPGVTGEGVFVMAPDGQSFTGKWRPAGGASWSDWTGKRVSSDSNPPPAEGNQPVAPGWSPQPVGPGRSPLPESPDEPKPVVYRYGNLPPGLPPYFYTTDGDADKDGQIGLYEWARYWDPKGTGLSDEKISEFKSLDLNADGLITAEEYLRVQKALAAAAPPKTASVGGTPPGGRPGWGQPPVANGPPPPSPGQPFGEPKRVPEMKR